MSRYKKFLIVFLFLATIISLGYATSPVSALLLPACPENFTQSQGSCFDASNQACDCGGGAPSSPPTVSLTANPTSIAYNASSILSWFSSNVNYCTASGGWSETKATSGSQSTGNLTSSKTYNLSCGNTYTTTQGAYCSGSTTRAFNAYCNSGDTEISSVTKICQNGAKDSYKSSVTCFKQTTSSSASVTVNAVVNTLPAPTQCSATAFQYPAHATINAWDNHNGSEGYSIFRDNNDNNFSYLTDVTGPSGSGPFSYGDYAIGSGWHKYKIVAHDTGCANCNVSAPCITNAVQVPLPSPTLTLTGNSITLQAGTTMTSTVNVNSSNISGNIDYSINKSLGLVDASVTPTTSSSATSNTYSVTAGSAGDYSVTITATATGTNETSVSDSVKIDVTVTAPPMSGALSSPDCIIASGGNSCNTAATWSITNPQGNTTAITWSGGASTVSNSSTPSSQSGTQSVTVPYPSRTFYLYNNGQLLAQDLQQASCISGTSWDGIKCAPPIKTYTLTYVAGAGCSISGATSQTVNYGASGTPVTAVPNTGYSFTGWTDNVSTATRTETNVTANKSVAATCTALPIGTLDVSPTSCTIADNASTCPVSISWKVTNPIPGASTAVTKDNPAGTTVSTAPSGTNVSNAINHGTTNFWLYHNSVSLAGPKSAIASCASNSDYISGFCRAKLTITATQAPNCTITPSGATSTIYGSDQLYTITPASGYNVSSLIIDGSTIAGSTSKIFSNVTANHTISAICTVSACTNGAINPPTCTPVGVCSSPMTAYDCKIGASGSNSLSYSGLNSNYSWSCTTAGGGASCSQTKVMSGKLTPKYPSCIITSVSSSCYINYSWDTINPQGTSAITSNVNDN